MNKLRSRCLLSRGLTLIGTRLYALGVAFFATAVSVAAEDAASITSREHVLFLGLEVSVEQPGGAAEVRGVSRGTVELVVAGETRTVPLRKVGNFNTSLVPKVGVPAITLSNVHAERAYSPGNDPALQATLQQSRMLALQGEQSQRQQAQEDRLAAAQSGAGNAGTDPNSLAASASAQVTMRSLQGSVAGGQSQLNMDAMRVADIRSAAGGTFDTFEVTFEISSAETLDDAYAIMLTTVQTQEKTDKPQRVLAFEKLPPITSKQRKIQITQSGLPLGFSYTNYQIHVYSRGREIATNMTSGRVKVSKLEAFQYLFYQHLAGNRGKSLPPVLVATLLDSDLQGKVSASDMKRRVEVQVGADGAVTSVVFGPSASRSGTDEPIEAFIRSALFYPALAAGKPVGGSVTLSLGDFVR